MAQLRNRWYIYQYEIQVPLSSTYIWNSFWCDEYLTEYEENLFLAQQILEDL
jgi:hypothetical protein